MKKIQEEIKTYKTKYVSTDGTEFESKDECLEYENTAKCVLNTRYNRLIKKTNSEFGIFGAGSDDYVIDMVMLNKHEDIDVVLNMNIVCNDYSMNDKYNDRLEKDLKVCEDALSNNDILLIYRGYNGDVFSIDRTIGSYINNMQKLRDNIINPDNNNK